MNGAGAVDNAGVVKCAGAMGGVGAMDHPGAGNAGGAASCEGAGGDTRVRGGGAGDGAKEERFGPVESETPHPRPPPRRGAQAPPRAEAPKPPRPPRERLESPRLVAMSSLCSRSWFRRGDIGLRGVARRSRDLYEVEEGR